MLLLVDGNSVGWTVWHALPPSVKESTDVGFVCGVWRHAFLTKLVKLVKAEGKGRALHTLIVWDGREGLSRRKVICESYKKKRSERRKKAARSDDPNLKYFEAVKEFTSLLSEAKTGEKFLIRFDELEADDVISALCTVASKTVPVIVYSGDMDLLQMLKFSNVKVIAPREDKEWTVEKVKKRFGVEPNYLWLYKAVVGDSSDEWSGIRGVGEKKFKKIIQEYGVEGALAEWYGREEIVVGRKLCELPAEWLLEKVFGEAWESVFLDTLQEYLEIEVDPAEVVLALDLRKLSTADLQYLM